MVDNLVAVVAFVVVAWLIALSIRRRARMSPAERELADLKRQTRALKREQDRRRWD